MKIVVSGATGFLGGHLCRHLHGLGHQVLGLGRDVLKGEVLRADGIAFEALDLASTTPLQTWNQADTFVHAAALSSTWGLRTAFEQANVTGTQHAITIARQLKVRRFVAISSPSVAFRFCDQLNLSEDAPLPPPVNDYAATKAIAEDMARTSDLNTLILRPRGIYGQGDTALLPRLIRAAQTQRLPLLRNGAAVTDLTHVDDVVAAIVSAIEAPQSYDGRTFNISGGEAIAVHHIISRASEAAGVTARFRPVPVWLALAAARAAEYIARHRIGQPEPPITAYGVGILAFSQTLDLTAARRDLGYNPQIDFSEGLRRTFAS
jgi:nucleoside-diphosphate-sugar epimerase